MSCVTALLAVAGCGGSSGGSSGTGGSAGHAGTTGTGKGGSGGSATGTGGAAGHAGASGATGGAGGATAGASGQGGAAGGGGLGGAAATGGAGGTATTGTGGAAGAGTGGAAGGAGTNGVAGAGGTGGTAGGAGTNGGGGSSAAGAGGGGAAGTSGVAGSGGAAGGSGGFGGAGGATVIAANGIALTVTANPDPAVAGGLITYEFKISNLGSGTQSNLTLTETTQSGATAVLAYSSGGPSCPNTGVVGQCAPGLFMNWPAFTLAPGQTQTLSMTSLVGSAVTNGTVIHSTATVNFTGGSIMESRDVLIDGTQSLHLSMTEDHNPVQPGDQLTYTIAVGNTGTQSLPLSNAGVLTAELPVGTTFVSASNGGTASNGLVQWSFGSVGPGANQHVTFTVAVGSPSDGTVLLSTAQLFDGATSLARAMTDTEVRATSPLKLVVAANPDPAAPGGLVTYELKISNLGTATLSNLTLYSTTQNGSTGVLAYSSGSTSCPNTGVVGQCAPGLFMDWPAFSLGPGQTQTLQMTSLVGTGAASGTVIRNQTTLNYPGGSVSQRRDVVVDGTQSLHVSMTEDHDPVQPGDQVTYAIAVGNTGTQSLPVSAAGVVTAVVPAGTTFVSASSGGTAANGVVTWNVGSLNPGGNQHYWFTVSVGTLSDGTVLQSAARVLDGTASLARAMTDTEVRAVSPLKVTVAVNPDPAVAGGLATYEIRVSNLGTTTLSNLTLWDQTQNSATGVLAYSAGGPSCPNTGVVGQCAPGLFFEWPAFSLAPGQTQTLQMTSLVGTGAANGTVIRNHVLLGYPGGTVSQRNDIVVDGSQSLHVSATEDHDPARPGDQVAYTITVGNTGTQSLPVSDAAVLTASVPVGTTFVSASNGGTAANGIVTWNVGAVNPGGNQHYSFAVAVGTMVSDGVILQSTVQLLDGAASLARATTDTEVRAASSLKVTVAPNADPVVPGGALAYEVKVSNLGTATLSNLTLWDQTQNSATGVLAYSVGGASCPNTGVVGQCAPGLFFVWPAFSLAPGQTQTVVMTSLVGTGAANGTVIRNHVLLGYPGGTVSQRNDVVVDSAQSLHVSLTPDHDPVQPGDQVTYTIGVGNTGTQSLPLSVAGALTAVLPAGTTFVSASSGGSASSGTVTWSVGSVNPGSVQHYTFTVGVGATASDGTVLQAKAQLFDGASSLARATSDAEVLASSPLKLTVSVSPNPAAPAALVTYTLTVTNSGTGSYTNLALTDTTLNNGTAILADTTGSATCPNTGVVGQCAPRLFLTWPAFSLGPGASQVFTTAVQVASGTPNGTELGNVARLDYPAGSVLWSGFISVHQ
jgi:uncharacterized repeat protein (TIGR01451 family)